MFSTALRRLAFSLPNRCLLLRRSELTTSFITMAKRKNKSGGGGGAQAAAKQACLDPQSGVKLEVDEKLTDNSDKGEAEIRLAESAAAAKGVQEVTEGQATIMFPDSVFYNRVQEFNRDLTVSVISQYAVDQAGETQPSPPGVKAEHGIKILEALGASGLRSMRFAKEVPGVKEIVCNDFDEKAVEYIRSNIVKNNVGSLVRASSGDASLVMQQCRLYESKYDVIDLDPYGSPSQFLDGALLAIKDGGLLCVTATDMAVMSGNCGETCFNKYGAYAIRTKACHEMGLRILLRSIESHATRHSKYTVPILSVSADFYIRVFVRVYEGANMAKFSASKQGMIYQCNGCGTQSIQPLGYSMLQENGEYKHVPGSGPPVGRRCDHCGDRHKVAGPVWIGRIHDREFLQRLYHRVEGKKELGTQRRMLGTLKMMMEELPDVVLYHVMDELARTLHCCAIPMVKFRSALLNAGYHVSSTHAHRNAVKTTAPISVVWDILRLWVLLNPISQKRLQTDSVAKSLLEVPPSIEVSFELHDAANPESKEQGFLRFQQNPEKDWGPKSRAKPLDPDQAEKKKKKLEIKRQRKRQKVPCKSTIAGVECPNGEECGYSHDPELAKSFVPFLKRVPCKKFLKNECNLPESECRNHHKGHVYLTAKGEAKPPRDAAGNGADGTDDPDAAILGEAIDIAINPIAPTKLDS